MERKKRYSSIRRNDRRNFLKTFRTIPDEKGFEGFPFEESKKKRAPLRLHLFVARKNGEKSRNAKGRSVG